MWALGAMTREEALAGLEPAERQSLFAALEKIRGNLSERGPLRAAEGPEGVDELVQSLAGAGHG